jgi:hypothetical protein
MSVILVRDAYKMDDIRLVAIRTYYTSKKITQSSKQGFARCLILVRLICLICVIIMIILFLLLLLFHVSILVWLIYVICVIVVVILF